MPQFAQFIYVRGSGETTDKAFKATGHVFEFDLPDLNTERTVVIIFKVSGPA
jgi:hypothetical protein